MKQPQQFQLTPQRLATVLVLEQCINTLQIATMQLKQLALANEARTVEASAQSLVDAMNAWQKEWACAIVIAPAGTPLPKLERVG